MNYLLCFVFCFSFRPESLLLKDYCDERYTRRSWGPRLIAGTPGESQENSRVTWGPSLSNVHIATLNCHCICCLGNKVSAFSEIPEASWTVLRWCCSWGPCEKSAVYQPVLSKCQLPLDHTHPQDMDSLLQMFSPRPPFFFLLSYPFSPGPRISALTQLSLDQYQLWKITCWTHWQGTNGWSGQISKGGLQFSRKQEIHAYRIQASQGQLASVWGQLRVSAFLLPLEW